jgi:hypothetical protein
MRQLQANDTMEAAYDLGGQFDRRPEYLARGCAYEFEWYENASENRYGQGVVMVHAFGKDDRLIWSGSTFYDVGDRVIDVVRWARDSAKNG